MKSIKILITISFLLSSSALSLAQEQAVDIDEQTRRLASVQDSIKQKEIEKNKLSKTETVFRRDVANLDRLINAAGRKLENIAQDIKKAEKNLEEAAKNYDNASKQKAVISKDINEELLLFNKANIIESYSRNPVEYKVRQKSIQGKHIDFNAEKKRADTSSAEMKKWERAKNNLLQLRKKENAVMEERKRLIEQKNDLLKDTTSRRRQTEAEIRELNASAKALQAVIDRLIAEARRRRAAEQKKEADRIAKERRESGQSASIVPPPRPSIVPAGPTSRKSIPWPVEGAVVSNFGRNRHQELDTYVVNNGIRIKAANASRVRSVDTGTVVFRGNISSYGKVVIVEHGTFFAVYGQLSDVSVRNGENIKRGDVIGRLGTGENSVLYFEIRRDDVPDNPMLWLR
jgi:septal ring factor EnvC (AmiA/AmiB activator)